MNPRRIGILVVAIVVAAVAAIGLLSYVRNVEDSALDDGEAAKVWVVKQPIRKGTSASQALAQQMIVQEDFPAKYRPSNAIVDPEVELVGLVAVFDLPANEIIKDGNFVTPNVINTGITDRLEEKGHVTVSLSVDQVKGASHQIQPGDFVNILMDRPASAEAVAPSGDSPEGAPAAASGDNIYPRSVRYVYQKAEILAVDKDLTPDIADSADSEEGAPVQQEARNDGLITLSVPPEAAQLLLSVGQENLYLSLVPRNYVPKAIPPFDAANQTFPGEDDERLTPYGPDDAENTNEEEEE